MSSSLTRILIAITVIAVALGIFRLERAKPRLRAEGQTSAATPLAPAMRVEQAHPLKNVEVADTVFHYYDIRGSSANELHAAMRASGPLDSLGSGRPRSGRCHWSVKYWIHYSESGGLCSISSAQIAVNSEIDLPHWIDRDAAATALREQWDRYEAALRTHELGHLDNGIRFANALAIRLAGIPAQAQCNSLPVLAQHEFDTTLPDFNRMDVEYDRVTNHGELQGAVMR